MGQFEQVSCVNVLIAQCYLADPNILHFYVMNF